MREIKFRALVFPVEYRFGVELQTKQERDVR